MAQDDLRVAFLIEGIGFDESKSEAAEWSYREDPDHGIPALAELPKTIDTFLDPLTGDISLSSFSPVFHYGEDDPTAAKQACLKLFDKDTTFEATLSADLDNSSTTLLTTTSGLDDEVVYINTETVKLGSFSNDADGNGNAGYTGCTRDYWSVPNGLGARAHEADGRIYQEPPYWRARVVNIRVNRDGVGTVHSTLTIVNATTSEDGTTIRLQCDNLYSRLFGENLNQEAEPLPNEELGFQWDRVGYGDEIELSTGSALKSSQIIDTQVHKPDTWGSNDRPIALQVGEGLFLNPYGPTDDPALGSKADPDVPDQFNAQVDVEADIWEIAAFGSEIERLNSRSEPDPTPTRNLDDPHHPVRIFSALMQSEEATTTEDTSSDDVLQGPWGVGIPVTNVDAAVDETPWLEIDHLILGWDGESVNFTDVGYHQLLRNYGYVLALKQNGEASIERWGLPTVEDRNNVDTIDALPGQIQHDAGYNRDVDKIVAKVGELPWREPRDLNVPLVNKPGPRWKEGERWELHYPTLKRSTGWDYIHGHLVSEMLKLRNGYPTITVAVDNPSRTGVDYQIAKWVQINELPPQKDWAVVDGARSSPDGGDEWLGFIVGLKQNLQDDTYELELMWRFFDTVKWRAPSMEVTDSNSGGDNDKAYTSSGTQFGYTTSDNEAFDVGDEIEMYGRTGVTVQSSVYEITNIGSDGTGPFVQISGTWDSDPTGDFVQLADLDSWSNNNTALADIGRPWLYLADSDGKMGSADVDADIYGL